MNELNKSLSATRGAGLMLNIVIGAGLLTLPGLAVETAGNHAIWAWGACALVAAPLLAVFIVMGRRFPNAGGIAHFARAAFGDKAYAATSLVFLGAVALGLPAIALAGGHYIAEILPGDPAFHAAVLVVAGAAAHLASAETAARVSTAAASGIVVALLAFIATGFAAADWNTAGDKFPAPAELDFRLVFAPFMMIFFSFTGWEVAANTTEEFRNPAKDFPRAMLMSFGGVCAIYFATAFVVQVAPPADAYEAPFAAIAGAVFGAAGKAAVVVLAAAIVFANLAGALWAVSRMVYALGREGYLPFRPRANRRGSPVSSVLLVAAVLLGVLALDWLGVLDIRRMLTLAGQNFLLLYGVTALALLRLRGGMMEAALSVFVVLLVVLLLVLEGLHLWYPLLLGMFGVLWFWFRSRKGGDGGGD